MGILSTAQDAQKFDLGRSMAYATEHGAPSPWVQLSEILRGRLGRQRFQVEEYYKYAFYLPRNQGAAMQRYVSIPHNFKLNTELARDPAFIRSAQTQHKLVSETFLRGAGLTVSRTRAAFGPIANLPPDVRHLTGAADIVAFLTDPANLPVFGKPLLGSESHGVVRIEAVGPAPGEVILGNGKTVLATQIAAEVFAGWSEGYIFQELLLNSASLRPVLGRATATLRICTLWGGDGPKPLYAVQKLPSATAMHDAASVNDRGYMGVDMATGRVATANLFWKLASPSPTHWQDPATPLKGLLLPDFDAALDLACRAHVLFPDLGILGSDIILTDDGPVLNEVNSNPAHMIYQTAWNHGLLQPEIKDRLDETRAFMAAKRGRAT